MSATVFVDTNVLLYARDASERTKQPQARHWLDVLWEQRAGRLSFQVLNEYYTAVTRKLKSGLSRDEARAELRDLISWRPVGVDTAMLDDAWWLEDRFGLAWWDALIVAAARATGSRHLLTEDLQAGQVLDGLVVVSPFSLRPEEMLPG